jgi:hypothetical protein
MVATIIFIALLFIDLVINCDRHGEPRVGYKWDVLNHYNIWLALAQFAVFMILLYYMRAFENFK